MGGRDSDETVEGASRGVGDGFTVTTGGQAAGSTVGRVYSLIGLQCHTVIRVTMSAVLMMPSFSQATMPAFCSSSHGRTGSTPWHPALRGAFPALFFPATFRHVRSAATVGCLRRARRRLFTCMHAFTGDLSVHRQGHQGEVLLRVGKS